MQTKSKLIVTLIFQVAVSRSISAANSYVQTNLVSDLPGVAMQTDPNLVNPWGLALGTNSGLWIAENGSGKAATYDGTGQAIPTGSPQTSPTTCTFRAVKFM